uniref:Uncharacterized protein n=1 Tax=Cucumis melo TaxID=3656 RepID=A0A9I9DVC8_CUCME
MVGLDGRRWLKYFERRLCTWGERKRIAWRKMLESGQGIALLGSGEGHNLQRWLWERVSTKNAEQIKKKVSLQTGVKRLYANDDLWLGLL